MVASNMSQLENMLISHMQKAMGVASERIKADVMEETYNFYSGSSPKMYVRTGALGSTPEVTGLTSKGKSVSFDAYLDDSHRYDTGDNPSMAQVLQLADRGIPWVTSSGATARPTVGNSGFWERSEKKMQKTLDDVMRLFF